MKSRSRNKIAVAAESTRGTQSNQKGPFSFQWSLFYIQARNKENSAGKFGARKPQRRTYHATYCKYDVWEYR